MRIVAKPGAGQQRPGACTPEDASHCFMGTEIEVLVAAPTACSTRRARTRR
jgi:hypothetical protein